MLSSTVIGVELHRLGLKFNFGQVEVQLGFASLDFNLASMDLIGVCGGSPRATPLKFNFGQVELETKSVKFNTNYRWT